jgi:chaperone BCS1
VFLPGRQVQSLKEDLENFLSQRPRFEQLGVPWRRGYLFQGIPGSGKTKLCMALCRQLHLSLAVINLTHPLINDSSLPAALQKIPGTQALLLEDLDRVVGELGKEKGTLTLSGLLNVLDGSMSQEGRVVFLTTNHPGRLDPALIRPGRIDVVVPFGPATPDQAEAYFLHFFPGHEQGAQRFAGWAGSGAYSMAQLQSHLMEHRNDPEAACRPPKRKNHG